MHTAQIQRARCGAVLFEPGYFLEDLGSSGCHAFMPICCLQPAASFIPDFWRHPVRESCTRKRSRYSIPKKLLCGDGKTEFDEASIGCGITDIDAPPGKCAVVVITDVSPI